MNIREPDLKAKAQKFTWNGHIFTTHLLLLSFVRYVNALRTKSTVYKEKRAELSELRAESGVLARTCEVFDAGHMWLWL